jgi:DNA-binding ferritin-like protein
MASHDQAATFVSVLLHSATNAHFMHLQTKSYSVHQALGSYYDDIVEATDRWAETYQGHHGVIGEYPSTFHLVKEPVNYIKELIDFVDDMEDALPKDPDLENIRQDIRALLATTLYKLENLK